jgi:hypothetical protein
MSHQKNEQLDKLEAELKKVLTERDLAAGQVPGDADKSFVSFWNIDLEWNL